MHYQMEANVYTLIYYPLVDQAAPGANINVIQVNIERAEGEVCCCFISFATLLTWSGYLVSVCVCDVTSCMQCQCFQYKHIILAPVLL